MRCAVILALLAGCGHLDFDPIPLPPGGGSGASRITAGDTFTCVLRGGAPWCWGASELDQLGLVSQARQTTPANVTTLPQSLVAIDAGDNSACAIDATGAVWCWGDNSAGEIGVNSSAPQLPPMQVPLASRAVEVSVGGRHACALLEDGTLWCWGRNADQESAPPSAGLIVMLPLQALDQVAHVSAGFDFTCALRADRSVWCWGNNLYGAIGPGTNGDVPAPVAGVSANAIAAGGHFTCALLDGGHYNCWGAAGDAQLGRDTAGVGVAPPGPASALDGITAITAGDAFACVLRGDGTTWCWGDGNNAEQGNGMRNDQTDPHPVAVTGTVVALGSGGDHTCALRDDDSVACWGLGSYGELGDGTGSELVPQQAMLPGAASLVAAGGMHACAIVSGSAYCWGLDDDLQLGDTTPPGTDLTANVPQQVPGLTGATALALGHRHSCAIAAGNLVVCWGSDSAGQCGDRRTQYAASPAAVVGVPTPIDAIAAGDLFTCAVANSDVWCWGDDWYGQIGDIGAPNADVLLPHAVGIANATRVAAGAQHACAIDVSNTLSCWGDGGSGQIGAGMDSANQPVTVLAAGFSRVAAGGMHTCGIPTTATPLECWGSNGVGQLGDGSFSDHDMPMPAMVSGGPSDVRAHDDETCALIGNQAFCWGDGDVGQHGDGTTITTANPVRVQLANVTQLAVGDDFACALDSVGNVSCWGDNGFGQIGNGKQAWALVPTEAKFP